MAGVLPLVVAPLLTYKVKKVQTPAQFTAENRALCLVWLSAPLRTTASNIVEPVCKVTTLPSMIVDTLSEFSW